MNYVLEPRVRARFQDGANNFEGLNIDDKQATIQQHGRQNLCGTTKDEINNQGTTVVQTYRVNPRPTVHP